MRIHHGHGQSLPDWIRLRYGAFHRLPDGVAEPPTAEGMAELMVWARDRGVAVIPYGGGTSVVGHLEVPAHESRPVLILSLRAMRRMTHLDATSRLATFEAGVRGPDLEAQLRNLGLTLGHFPQSFEYSTLGGWVVTRSSGQQSAFFGRIEDLLAGGELITPKGRWALPFFPASAAGPDLRHWVMGSEGRMGILATACVKIRKIPEIDRIFGLFFPSWERAVAAVRILAGSGLGYSMIRLSNPLETAANLVLGGRPRDVSRLQTYLRFRGLDLNQACLCLVGFTGAKRSAVRDARAGLAEFRRHGAIVIGRPMGARWKANRFRLPYLRNALWDMGYAVDTLETAVPWVLLQRLLSTVEDAIANGLTAWGERVLVFSHLSHVYPQGSSLYTTFAFRIGTTAEETLEKWTRIKTAASQAIVACGGTISHQHGVGSDHRAYLEAEKGVVGMGILRAAIADIDPSGMMNPGSLL